MHQQEHEVKLESSANTQLKYSTIDRPETLETKFKCLLSLLKLKYVCTETQELKDEYYDDQSNSIQGAGFSLRVRKGECQNSRLTLKSKDSGGAHVGLLRSEYEIDLEPHQLKLTLSDPNVLAERFPGTIRTCGKLECIFALNNCRLFVRFETSKGEHRMCYDRFYFFNAKSGSFSPFFSEVELESLTHTPDDPELDEIRRAMETIFSLRQHRQSKLERARDFFSHKYPPLTSVATIGLDIVGYSQRDETRQLESIQLLNKIAKDAARELIGDPFECIYIPTGDGMFLVLENNFDKIIPIVCESQKRVRRHNADVTLADQFSFRTSVHYGPVFRYSDVNENLNYAGNGINLAARVLNYGDEWHVFVSDAARTLLVASGEDPSIFHDTGIKTAKHGVKIQIHNVHRQTPPLGNIADPF